MSMETDIMCKHETSKGRLLRVGSEGYAIKTGKGPVVGYALEDSHMSPDGKHHIVRAVLKL